MGNSLRQDVYDYIIVRKEELKSIKWYKFKKRRIIKQEINAAWHLILSGHLD